MIKTKTQALDIYRHLKNRPKLTMANLFEAMGFDRATQYNWPEELNDKQQDIVNGFMLRLENDQ